MRFPVLTITADRLEAMGAFAENQASYLNPDPATVAELAALCADRKVGIVAHFYMDAEIQGVLTRLPAEHVTIADSLAMADAAVAQARAGARAIVVLGVDFMSENVRAVLDGAGFADVAVYRLASEAIGCSLAASADGPAYDAWLRRASGSHRPLHVVYINTSLLTKARAHAVVPTITCTSSNVVRTLLQAAAQVPDVSIWYGPDTYMGGNLRTLLERYASLPDAAVQAIHPDATAASVRALLDRFQYFSQGHCVVHHLFGDEVVAQVRRDHADALLTAHLEVPGEMFALAADAATRDRGVVGSTSDILGFILRKVEEAVAAGERRVEVVLGTEAGMVTSIVRQVQRRLAGRDVAVDIVFPVAAEAVAQVDDPLGVVPGVHAFEGCSVAGGCATCPYMKMNTLDALFHVVAAVGGPQEAALVAYRPKVYRELVGGRSAADVGGEPIRFMRAFQQTGRLPEALVAQVTA